MKNIINKDQLDYLLERKQISIFEIYKHMAAIFEINLVEENLDFEFYRKLKFMVEELVLVKPESRMKLDDARNKLNELEKFGINDFLLLESFLQKNDPTMLNIQQSSQTLSTAASELFTIETDDSEQRITQRISKLCVSISAMRLLSYALVSFLEMHLDKKNKFQNFEEIILKYPKSAEIYENNPSFIQQLITICCGVISPRSLNGLNFDRYDVFQITAQEQNIRKFFIVFFLYLKILKGDLLERLCNKTEFEEEGWRKIPPIMRILHENFSVEYVAKMQLIMTQLNPINGKNHLHDDDSPYEYSEIKIKDSWIYRHFKPDNSVEKNPLPIAVYVNEILPINQNLTADRINFVRNHCVLVKGVKEKSINGQTVEFLELDKNSHADIREIPIDFPFFEKVQFDLKKIFINNPGVDQLELKLNQYGKKLAELKYSCLEKNWYNLKKNFKTDLENDTRYNQSQSKYNMTFIRSRIPCFQLKFNPKMTQETN